MHKTLIKIGGRTQRILFVFLLFALTPFSLMAEEQSNMNFSVPEMMKEIRAFEKQENSPDIDVTFILEKYIPAKSKEEIIVKHLVKNGFEGSKREKNTNINVWALERNIIPWWRILYGRVDLRIVLEFQNGVLEDMYGMVFLTAL